MASSDTTVPGPELPPVDERLATPETRYEVHDGELVYVPPCDEPHGRRQSKICALIEAHVAHDFTVASEMLTRTSKTNDFAPDVSVYPRARDPRTGGRQLEQLAFEVVSTEALSHAGRKAGKLMDRGVRRVFAINIERARALEWSSALENWSMLDSGAALEDPALAAPLPIAALLTAACADDEIARALIIKRNPVIEATTLEAEQRGRIRGRFEAAVKERAEGRAEGREEGRAEGREAGRAEGWEEGRAEGQARGREEGRAEGQARGREEGKVEGLASALLALLEVRGIALDDRARARIVEERDSRRLLAWIARASTRADIAEVLEGA